LAEKYNTLDRRNRIAALKYVQTRFSTGSHPGYWYYVNVDEERPNKAGWLNDTEPWAGFSPCLGFQTGEMLSCVNIADNMIPSVIDQSPEGEFILKRRIQYEWETLEKVLVGLLLFLHKGSTLAHLPASGGVTYPVDCGYKRTYSERSDAEGAVMNSRNAFIVFSTRISFLLAFWRFPWMNNPLLPFISCLGKAASNTQFGMRQLVLESIVGHFHTSSRSGYCIDLYNHPTPWLHYIHIFAEAGVPLYIYAGPRPLEALTGARSVSHEYLAVFEDWHPAAGMLDRAYARFLEKILVSIPAPSGLAYPHRDSALVPLDRCSRFFDDYKDYMKPDEFKRMKVDKHQAWKTNNPHITSDAIQQLESAAAFDSWTEYVHRPLAMYHWVLDGKVWTRLRISSSLKESYFAMYSPSQRLFCPLYQTIDMCWAWDTTVPPPDLTFNVTQNPSMSSPFAAPAEEHSPFADMSNPPTEDTMDVDSLPPILNFNPCELDDSSDYGGSDEEGPTPQARSAPSSTNVQSSVAGSQATSNLIRILHIRLGYSLSGAPLSPPNLKAIANHEKSPWKAAAQRSQLCLKALGERESLASELSPLEREAIADVVATLDASTQGEHRRHLSTRWDISPGSTLPSAPPSITHWLVRYEPKVSQPRSGASGKGKGREQKVDPPPIQTRVFVGVTQSSIQDQWWGIVVTPGVLLELYRARPGGILAMARYLIQHGIRFSTAKAVSAGYTPPWPLPIARDGVAYLDYGAEVPASVYLQYEAERNRLLRTARGPYALKEGGLLWRLAKDHISAREITKWLNRPTDVSGRRGHVNEDRRQEWCGSSQGLHLYEDVLTPTEYDTILGTCHEVYESPKNKGVIHDTIAYFWPPPTAWRLSHMNTGAWTLEAEDWYQQRLLSLRSGTAKAHTIGEWKKNLRGMKFKHKIWVNYSLLAGAGKLISCIEFTCTDRFSSPVILLANVGVSVGLATTYQLTRSLKSTLSLLRRVFRFSNQNILRTLSLALVCPCFPQ
jgi:hypothetical protein